MDSFAAYLELCPRFESDPFRWKANSDEIGYERPLMPFTRLMYKRPVNGRVAG